MRIKICGITLAEDARLATELGAWALGFVFWPDSPRYIEPDRAREIVRSLPPLALPIGVFVDQPPEHVNRVAAHVGLGAVQLHGSETPTFVRALSCRVVKALPLSETGDVHGLDEWTGSLVLLDAFDPVRKGGTGRAVDWEAAARIARRRPIVLAGGLSPTNVERAIAAVAPVAIDVSSGVEAEPGIKDSARMRDLFEAARLAGGAPS